MDGSFLGLGYSHGGGEAPPSSAVDAADSLMKHYLQQCLDFHAEHQQHPQKEEGVPQFVTAQHPLRPESPTCSHVQTESPGQHSVPSVVSINPLSNPSTQEAIAKARAIVQKFQQQQFPLANSTILPADYRRRREQQMELEKQRLHKATLKNFEYVARKEEERLQLQLAQLQETRILEQQLQRQHAAFLKERREKQTLMSKAGIGTSQRQAVEQNKLRKGHAVVARPTDASVAIYLSGLPKDGSMTEDAVRLLFASYGSIHRVHLYRNKQTGELKGDALVVYNAGKATETEEILHAACSQMNGAELPCGNILRVEPADPRHKQSQGHGNGANTKKDRSNLCHEVGTSVDEDVGYYGPSLGAREKCESMTDEKGDNGCCNDEAEEKDLDDFFESLT